MSTTASDLQKPLDTEEPIITVRPMALTQITNFAFDTGAVTTEFDRSGHPYSESKVSFADADGNLTDFQVADLHGGVFQVDSIRIEVQRFTADDGERVEQFTVFVHGRDVNAKGKPDGRQNRNSEFRTKFGYTAADAIIKAIDFDSVPEALQTAFVTKEGACFLSPIIVQVRITNQKGA